MNAATNDLSRLVQQGLFEEEANHDLEAAAKAYGAVVSQFDKDRKLAATAIFRLGEVYRKQGKTNEANAMYERIVREFSDQKVFSDLSRKSLPHTTVTSSTAQQFPALHVPRASEEAGAIVIDNTSAEFTGNWQLSSTNWPGTYGPDYRFAATSGNRSNATATAIYRPHIKTAGRYDVHVWYPQGSNRSTKVPVRIRFPNSYPPPAYSEHQSLVDQQRNGGKWLPLMSNVPFDAGTNCYVTISNNTGDTNAGTVVIADAVRFVPTPEETSTKANRLEQEIQLVQQQLDEMQQRIELGRGTRGDALALQRELLALQNAQAESLEKHDEALGRESSEAVTVRAGDTVSSILQQYNKQGHNITLKQLLEANPKMDPRRLRVGDRITFPALQDSAAATSAVVAPATSEEAEEIRRIQALIKNSPDLINAINTPLSDRENPERGSPLHKAAINGHMSVAKFLLDNGAEVESKSNKNQTPLGLATQNGHKAMVELLLSRGANVNAPSGGERTTALHIAAQNGFATLVQTLLAHKTNPNAGDWNNRTPLHAARRDHSVIITSLIDAGADVNAKSKFGHTPLFSIQNPDLARLMIAKGANLNIAGDDGITVLWRAVESGNEALIKLFLEKGAKLDVTVGDRTLLHLAAEKATASVISLLARAGADPNAISGSHPQTPLLTATHARNLENVKALIGAKADVNATNSHGVTALHTAASNGFADGARELIAAGAKLNAQTLDGSTPLLVAVTVGKIDVVELLLAKGADPNLPTKDSRTPLAFAKEKASSRITYQNPGDAPVNWPKIVELLEKHGANENAQRRSRISASRSGVTQPQPVFFQGTNNVICYSLFELFATIYQDFWSTLPNGQQITFHEHFRFPDLTKVRIHRLGPKDEVTEIPINLETLINSGDCRNDIWLEWGDIVEIPERDRLASESWTALPEDLVRRVAKCLERNITVVVKGETNVVTLKPEVNVRGLRSTGNLALFSRFEARVDNAVNGLLRASSDTTRMKLWHADPRTKQRYEFTVSFQMLRHNFWLRDGDRIEVPERQAAAPATSGTEPDLRSIPTRTLILPQAPTVGQQPPTPTVVPSLRTIPTKTLRMPPVSTPASPGGTNTDTAKP